MRLSIRTKLLGGFAAVLAMLSIVATIGIIQSNTVSGDANDIATDQVQASILIGRARADFEEYRARTIIQMLTPLIPAEALTLLRERIAEQQAESGDPAESAGDGQSPEAQAKVGERVDEALAALRGHLDDPGAILALDNFEADWQTYREITETSIIPQLTEGNIMTALVDTVTVAEPAYAAAIVESAALVDADVASAAVTLEDAQSANRDARVITLVTTGVAIAVGFVLAFWLARGISGGVAAVAQAADRIKQGQLDIDLDASGSDEIGAMARSFQEMVAYLQEKASVANAIAAGDLTVDASAKSANDVLGTSLATMTQNLRSVVTEVKDMARLLRSSAETLTTAASASGESTQQISLTIQDVAESATKQAETIASTASSIGELVSAVQEVASGAARQAQSVDTTSSTVHEMTKALDEIASNSASVSEMSAQAYEAATSGSLAVRRTADGMEAIRVAVNDAATSVQGLGEYSARIGDIVAVIDDIAEQTNLLALNAAIEAARAGEHGRGFAVVADEVRKLAERSGQATKEIATLIGAVQSGTDDVIRAIESSVGDVDKGAELAVETGEALTSILNAVQATNQQVQQIAAAAEEIAASSTEVVTSMETISTITTQNAAAAGQMAQNSNRVADAIQAVAASSEENSAATEEISAGAQMLATQTGDISGSADALNRLANDLNEAVALFKIDGAPTTVRSIGWNDANPAPSHAGTRDDQAAEAAA